MQRISPPLIDLSEPQKPNPSATLPSFPPPFQPYIPSLPHHYSPEQAFTITSTIDIAIRLVQANQIALHQVSARLDASESLLHSQIGHLSRQAIRYTQESRLILRELNDGMARTLKRPPFIHPRAIPTSAIANAKDKDLPSDSSSSFSRHTDISAPPSSPIATPQTPASLAAHVSPPKARFARLHSPLAHSSPVADSTANDYFDDTDIATESTETKGANVISPKKRDLEISVTEEVKAPAQASSNKRMKTSPVPPDTPLKPASPAPPVFTTTLDPVSNPTQRRRSTRTKTSPEKQLAAVPPPVPSSFPQSARSSKSMNKALNDKSGKLRKPTAAIPKRNEAIQLKMGLGIVRAVGAVWQKKKSNTLRGTAIDVICQKCCGRAHLSCAGLTPEDEYPEEWECPDCKHVKRNGGTKLITDPANYNKCIRKDCILRQKQKRKYEVGDELEYSLDKIIGRRRAKDWSPDNKVFEYLLRWNGINSATGQMWGLEDSTWEPKENIHKIEQEQMAFFEACTAEGLDPRANNPKPVLLKEALGKWTEEGELIGDGWSKKIMAFVMAQGKAGV